MENNLKKIKDYTEVLVRAIEFKLDQLKPEGYEKHLMENNLSDLLGILNLVKSLEKNNDNS